VGVAVEDGVDAVGLVGEHPINKRSKLARASSTFVD
jgi:hypothetical protein